VMTNRWYPMETRQNYEIKKRHSKAVVQQAALSPPHRSQTAQMSFSKLTNLVLECGAFRPGEGMVEQLVWDTSIPMGLRPSVSNISYCAFLSSPECTASRLAASPRARNALLCRTCHWSGQYLLTSSQPGALTSDWQESQHNDPAALYAK
jgi:hypothetical protein